MKLEVPGGIRKEPSTTWVWLVGVASAQLNVQICGGAVGSTWLHTSSTPPNSAAPPQLTIVLPTAGVDARSVNGVDARSVNELDARSANMPAIGLGIATDRRIAVILGRSFLARRTTRRPQMGSPAPLPRRIAVHKFVNRHSAARLARAEHACYMFTDSKLAY
jgi:hypothetical protein